jgi:hypothetical protein
VICAHRRDPTESSSEATAARDSCKTGDARVTAGANRARLLGESAVWKLVSYGGDVLGQDSPESPGSDGASPYLRRGFPA